MSLRWLSHPPFPRPSAHSLRGLGALLCWAWLLLPAAAAAEETVFDVLHYQVRVEPDIAAGTVLGAETVELRTVQPTASLQLDAGQLEISRVRAAGKPVNYEKQGRQLQVLLPEPVAANTRMLLEIDYRGTPAFGMEFHPKRDEVYTIFSTSQWMVAVDAPSERATLELEVVLPKGLKAAGTGTALPTRRLKDGRVLHRWRQAVAMPSFLYGFAAGKYQEAAEKNDGFDLRYLSADADQAELRKIFTHTADMLTFFGNIAGIPYRGRYSQALVAETIGQEMAGLTLLSERHGRGVLDNPADQALIAHEAAHQWWGALVTCQDWTHFWLNEGFANFMAAAYLQHRFGEAAYAEQVAGWKQRLDRLRASGTDRPLTFDRWYKPTADDRAVVYQKGAYVLHLLREELGEDAFWSGIRAYTLQHQGGSVTGADFRRAMERSSGRDLSRFFAEWVDPAAASDRTTP